MTASNSKFDLEERLLEFSVAVVRRAQKLPNSSTERHVAGQLIRSGTSPMAHHAEAQAAESRRDFVHKMKVGHKELRETIRWVKLSQRVPLLEVPDEATPVLDENEQLIRIFHASITTARNNDYS